MISTKISKKLAPDLLELYVIQAGTRMWLLTASLWPEFVEHVNMSELSQTPNITPLVSGQNTQSPNFAQALASRSTERTNLEMLSGSINDKDLGALTRFLASRLLVPESMAFKMIRQFAGTGQASNFTDLKNFFVKMFQTTNPLQNNEAILEQLRRPEIQAKPEKALEPLFKPLVQDLKDLFTTAYREQNVRGKAESFSREPAQATRTQITNLVSSPQAFASWLVNNKAAFLMLKTNPEMVNLLMALRNPDIAKSPVLLQEVYKMITQLIKLKRGRSQVEDFDDVVKENLDHAARQEAIEHEANIVNTLKQVVENMPLSPLRNFLLEAERFAEEEVANMWSLALKKEKELEQRIGKRFKKR